MAEISLDSKDFCPPKEALDSAIRGELTLVVYHWRGFEGFLIQKIAPRAMALEAHPEDSVQDVLENLPDHPGVFLFQLNCSITRNFPPCRDALKLALIASGWILCNEDVEDITKRSLQRVLLEHGCNSVSIQRHGPLNELVVIKSNYNWGGSKEKELSEAQRHQLDVTHIPREGMDQKSYLAWPRRKVAKTSWDDPSLTIERYVGNRKKIYYRISVAGTRLHLVELANPHRIKKVAKSRVLDHFEVDLRSGPWLSHPRANRVLAEAVSTIRLLRLDFGSIDVVIDDDGNPYVIDVNITPWFNKHTHFPELLHHLSHGQVRDLPPKPNPKPRRSVGLGSAFRQWLSRIRVGS